MRVLIAYERSGKSRRAWRDAGHDAYSVDTQPAADASPFHIQAAVGDDDGPEGMIDAGSWDLIIAHPPCTYLSVSGAHWNHRRPGRADRTAEALRTVAWILDTPARYAARHHNPVRVCLENPVGVISSQIRPADQYLQPYQFGHDASKKTGLWLVGLPPVTVPPEVGWIQPRWVCPACKTTVFHNGATPAARQCRHPQAEYRPRWANQTDSGQNRLSPSPTRADERAETYQGIADAMLAAWSNL